MKDYDDSIAFLGHWGRFQQAVFFLLCASIVPNGFGVFFTVFLTDTPLHHCLVPEVNLSQAWRDATIPIEVIKFWITTPKKQMVECNSFSFKYSKRYLANLKGMYFVYVVCYVCWLIVESIKQHGTMHSTYSCWKCYPISLCHCDCEVVDGKQELSSCSRYRLDVVRNLSAQGLVPGRDVNLTDLEQEGCVDGWSYSKDIYQSTIVSEVSVYLGYM